MDNATSVARGTALLGLSTSLFLSGNNFSSSHLTLPILYRLPTSIQTSFFAEYYHRGLIALVPLTAVSAVSSATAAYLDEHKRTGYAMAAGLTIAALPWTQLVMAGVNARLIELSKDQRIAEKAGEEVVKLLRQWKWMNMVRSALALSGGLVGLSTFVGKT